MERAAYSLISNLDNAAKCESILQSLHSQYFHVTGSEDNTKHSLLYSFLHRFDDAMFRSLFHINRRTFYQLVHEIKQTKAFNTSLLTRFEEEDLNAVIAIAVLYINSRLSNLSCALISGFTVTAVDNYLNLFIRMMNELKDKVIRFPALNNQGLLRVNSKRFFPGAVGVVDTVFIPRLFLSDDSSRELKGKPEGIKLLLVVGRDGRFFNMHISEYGNRSNCAIYNESALGITLRCQKRSILNRGSFLIADRSFPELPYIQVPFSNKEIQSHLQPQLLTNYNYWHHKARFVAEKSIQQWLYRSPKCHEGLPFQTSRSCMAFIIASLVLHQFCQSRGDDWSEDDARIKCVVIASEDGQEHEEVNEACYNIYDMQPLTTGRMAEINYYDINNIRPDGGGEEVDESMLTSVYERLRVVARKRRDFLVDIVKQFPNRSILFSDD